MENFKKRVAREVIDQLKVENRYDLLDKFKLLVPRKRKHQYQIWQPDYYDFNIYTEKKLEEKINYLEITNPIKHKLVSHENIATYKYSSYRNRYLADDSLIKIDYLVI